MTAITRARYQRETDDQWRGRRVRSLEQISTGLGTLPAGTMFTIMRKFKGFNLRSDPCDCCRLQLNVREVHWTALELVGEQTIV